MAVPPASACIPTEDIAADSARISVSDNPAIVPADASLVAISVISDSVVAKLFPRATIVDPSLSTFSLPVPVILVNLARAVAASSADKLVVSPSMTIVLVKFSISSADTPSCPAASATPAISSLEDAVSVAIFMMDALRSSYEVVAVSSTVFMTPVKADSQSIADLAESVKAPTIGVVTFLVIEEPKEAILLPTLEIPSPTDFIFEPTSSKDDGSSSSSRFKLLRSV